MKQATISIFTNGLLVCAFLTLAHPRCANAELPQIDRTTLLEALNFADSLVQNVTCTYTVDEQFTKSIHAGLMPEKRRLEIEWRQEGIRDYIDVTVHDGTFIRGKPIRIINTYNGEKRLQWTPNETKGDVFREPIEHAWPIPIYCGMTLGKRAKKLGEALAECEIKTLDRRPYEGCDCYFVEAIQPNGAKAELWIDPNAGWRSRHTRLYRADGGIAYDASPTELRDCNNGIWFPVKGVSRIYGKGSSPGERIVSSVSTFAVDKVQVNAPLKQEDFEVKFPQGADVYDHIYGIGYVVGVTSLQGLDDATLDKITNAAKNTGQSPNQTSTTAQGAHATPSGSDSNAPNEAHPGERSGTVGAIPRSAGYAVVWAIAIIAALAIAIILLLAIAKSRSRS